MPCTGLMWTYDRVNQCLYKLMRQFITDEQNKIDRNKNACIILAHIFYAALYIF